MKDSNLVSRDIAVLPVIANKMVEMQIKHALPLEVILVEKVGKLQTVLFKYSVEDEYMVDWIVDKCTGPFLDGIILSSNGADI